MVDNNTSPWVLLSDMAKLGELADEPWTDVPVVAIRYKSSSDEAEAFLHDPLSVMMEDANDPDKGEAERAREAEADRARLERQHAHREPSGDAFDQAPQRGRCPEAGQSLGRDHDRQAEHGPAVVDRPARAGPPCAVVSG